MLPIAAIQIDSAPPQERTPRSFGRSGNFG
jgi:hypothetical protein